jgi:hypothetical protein
VNAPLEKSVGIALASLLTSSATLLCCVLPAAMVALGAGAALAGLVTAVPALVWLSEHKTVVFGSAGVMLALGGFSLLRARSLPCPADPDAAAMCVRLRRLSGALYALSLLAFAAGVVFAFVLPAIAS